MSRKTLFVVVISMIIGSACADRSLLQQNNHHGGQSGGKNTKAAARKPGGKVRTAQADGLYNCGGAQQLATDNLCCPLCWCLGNQNSMFASAAIQQLCNTKCTECGTVAQQCSSPDDDLPKTCKNGLQFNSMIKEIINKCINMYGKDPTAASRAQGC